jgi:DNA-binding transcriptional LysR family regulator
MTPLAPGRTLLDHARAILAAVERAVVETRAEDNPTSAPRGAASCDALRRSSTRA